MKPHDTLELFWDMAQLSDPVLAHDDLVQLPRGARDALFAAGLLTPCQTAQSVVCDACNEDHVEEVDAVTCPNGSTFMFIHCPEYGCIEVEPERLRQWTPRYGAAAELLAETFGATGGCRETVPGRLWDLGRAAVAGQSRPLWLARRITPDLAARLPADRVSVLFVLGTLPGDGRIRIAPERVFEVRHLVRLDEGRLCLDAEAVRGQLAQVLRAQPPEPRPGKLDRRARAVQAVKKAIRDQALMRKSVRKKNWDTALPPLTQKGLAELAGVSEPTLSRILNDGSDSRDRELQMLWEIVNRPEALMRYHG